MKNFSTWLIIGVILSTVASVASPAFALGGCGPNRHRNPYGYCVFGGQNQSWCLRHKGYLSADMGNGTRHCF